MVFIKKNVKIIFIFFHKILLDQQHQSLPYPPQQQLYPPQPTSSFQPQQQVYFVPPQSPQQHQVYFSAPSQPSQSPYAPTTVTSAARTMNAYDPEGGGASFEFDDQSIRKGFIRKVFSILSVSKFFTPAKIR